ncbi:MAG: hypothetical protein ACI9SB_001211, partial [Candidatus Azotimanducaceae bacterium]
MWAFEKFLQPLQRRFSLICKHAVIH